MKEKYKKTLKTAMTIVAATLMVCSFGCVSNNQKTSDDKPLEKMNQEATKAGDSLNKTVKKVADKAGEVANEAGDAINNAIETTSEKVSEKMTKEDK